MTTVRRETSNTPIGALVTLNNQIYVEAARAFGRRVFHSAAASDEGRLRHMLRLCLARQVDDAEVERLKALLAQSSVWYRKNPDDATKIVGADAPLETLAELAAWTATARVVLNLDEFITRE